MSKIKSILFSVYKRAKMENNVKAHKALLKKSSLWCHVYNWIQCKWGTQFSGHLFCHSDSWNGHPNKKFGKARGDRHNHVANCRITLVVFWSQLQMSFPFNKTFLCNEAIKVNLDEIFAHCGKIIFFVKKNRISWKII